MISLSAPGINLDSHISLGCRFIRAAALVVLFSFSFPLYAQISTNTADNTIVVESAPEMEIFSYGKTVIVRKDAKGVLTFGADIIIEGRVEGDVAAIGGSVIQKENAFIGGDVIILGGKYRPESANPLRNEGKETVMYAGYEEELRDLAQNPSQIFAPAFSLAFVAQRILSILFWFIVSLAFVTIAPGAISRAIARFQLSTLKVVGIGFFVFMATTIGLIGSFTVLPNYLSAIFGLMAFVMLMLAYVFGRVALHVSLGKLLQKHILPAGNQSETLTIFLGVLLWTLLLSIPYIWTLALFALFSTGIGLVVTARSPADWRRS